MKQMHNFRPKVYQFYHQSLDAVETWQSRPLESKKISNDQELIQSDPTSCPQNQKGNN